MTESLISAILRRNLLEVQAQVTAACQRSGRIPDDVQLIAVTKYAEWPWIAALSQLHGAFGENRPQQLAERHAQLPHIQWHLIGQLQRNKVRMAAEHAEVIHSVDSLRLLSRLADVAADLQVRPRVLLQVNITGEPSKSGFQAEELRRIWTDALQFATRIQLDGLMTIAREEDDAEKTRPAFSGLRQLRDLLISDPRAVECGVRLPHLSMGMSGDFIQAVEEGATLIRIGSRLFEGLEGLAEGPEQTG